MSDFKILPFLSEPGMQVGECKPWKEGRGSPGLTSETPVPTKLQRSVLQSQMETWCIV